MQISESSWRSLKLVPLGYNFLPAVYAHCHETGAPKQLSLSKNFTTLMYLFHITKPFLYLFIRPVAMAEVHGRNSPTAVDAGPADVTKPPDCHICDNVTATAYCTVCKIHLCTRCVHNHEKVPVTKAHKLLMGSAMPLLTDSSVIDTAFDQPEHCPDHQKEEIKFFCTKHTNLCCVACTVVKHRSCKIEYIPDVSKDFASSEEYMKLVERIKDIERLLAQCQADIHRCHDAVDRMSKYEIGIFRSFKAEIIAFLDKRESQLLTEIQRRRDEDNIILQNLKTRSELMNTATEEMKRKLRGIESNPERLFIMTKRFQYQVASLQTAVEEIQKKTGYRKYEVQKDASVEAVLNSATGVATVEDELGIALSYFLFYYSLNNFLISHFYFGVFSKSKY